MKVMTELSKVKKQIQTDLSELIMVALTYHLCDKLGFTAEQAMAAVRDILRLIDAIISDELHRQDLMDPLRDEYGIVFKRQSKGFKVELEENER